MTLAALMALFGVIVAPVLAQVSANPASRLLQVEGDLERLTWELFGSRQTRRLAQAALTEAHQTEADQLRERGNQQYQDSKFREALQSYQSALEIYREISEVYGASEALRTTEGEALLGIGNAYKDLGDYAQALEYYQQALAATREIGDVYGVSEALRSTKGKILNNIGIVYEKQGNYAQAIEYYQQSLAIKREIGDRLGEAITLGNIGIIYDLQGDYDQALNHYQQILGIFREIDDRLNAARVLGNIGIVYENLGNYPQALDHNQQALAITREINNRAAEGHALGNIGNVYQLLGDYPRTLNYSQQSLAIFREIGNRAGESIALNNIGAAYRNLRDYPQAIEHYQLSLAIKRDIGDRSGEAISLGNIGNVYRNLGDYPQALDYHQQSLAIKRDIDNPYGAAITLTNIGEVYQKLRNYPQALNYSQQALAIARQIGDRATEAHTLSNMGTTLFLSGKLLDAEEKLFEAIAVLESLRPQELSDDDKIKLFETQKLTYGVLQQVLVARTQPQRALEVAERGRTRAFVELLANRAEPQRIEQTSTNPPNFAEIQRIARQQNSVLVEYSLVDTGIGNSEIYIWVVQPDGEMHFRQVDLGDENIAALVTQSREAIGVRNRGGLEPANEEGTAAKQLQKLYQLLIEPIADILPQNAPKQRVIFIPHGKLFLVPFPAIIDDNGDYLIEQHTILTAPSIQVLDLAQKQRLALDYSQNLNPDQLLFVGNPAMPKVWDPSASDFRQLANLPGAEQEALAIANFLDSQPLLNATATEQQIKQQIETARVIHFATHGLLEYGRPEDSGFNDVPGAIALAPGQGEDGLLTSAEIGDLNLQAEFVVLSACDTGRGDITGDGVIGLSRSLFEAGVPSVIVSLWSVPDAPTADLMTEFYRQWRSGLDKAQALRQAMLATMATHPEPRDWAAFTLIGEAQ